MHTPTHTFVQSPPTVPDNKQTSLVSMQGTCRAAHERIKQRPAQLPRVCSLAIMARAACQSISLTCPPGILPLPGPKPAWRAQLSAHPSCSIATCTRARGQSERIRADFPILLAQACPHYWPRLGLKRPCVSSGIVGKRPISSLENTCIHTHGKADFNPVFPITNQILLMAVRSPLEHWLCG